MSGAAPKGGGPARLGKYEIRGTLGRGAMGIVYDGWDPVIDRRVAIKTVRLPGLDDEEAAEALARFKREAQAAGRLTHPNIVGVFDYGETDEVAYIVMEFVEGRSLKDSLAAGERMAPATAVTVLLEVLAGLAYSHERGVVHRDIKPANVMMAGGVQAKIADFGIARIEASSMTQAGTVMGTPAYMSPEQFMGQVVDGRTDIYSCGVMLYQLLTGDRPFDGSMTAIMHKVMNTVPPRPSELAVTAPSYLDPIVLRAMAKRPEDRFATAAAFAEALRAGPTTERPAAPFEADATVMAPPVRAEAAVPVSAAASTPPPKSRAPLLAGGGLAAAALLGAVAWFAWPRPEVPRPPVQTAMSTPPQTPVQPPPAGPPAAPPDPTPSGAPPAPPDPTSRAQVPEMPPTRGPSQTAVQTPAPPDPAPPDPAPPDPARAEPVKRGGQTVIGGVVVGQGHVVLPPSPPPRQQTSMAGPPASVPPGPTAPGPPPAHVMEMPPTTPRRTAAEIEAALAGALPSAGCSLVRDAVAADGTATISGLVRAGQSSETLRHIVDSARPAAVTWQVAEFEGPFCPVLDLIRPPRDANAAGRLEAAQGGGGGVLKDGQAIKLQVTMPDFGGYLHVEYLQSDGSVSPLMPGPAYPSITYAARARVDLDPPARPPQFAGWTVGPPFGKDMILVVASTAPLFQRPPPGDQPIAAYLAALRTAIEDVRRHGGQVSAAAVLLDTREK